MFESIVAALALFVCAALLLRQCLPAARQRRVDASARELWQGLLALPRRWRARGQVRRAASDAIDRARRTGPGRPAAHPPPWQRQGNVYRPSAFESRPPPPDRRH